MSAGSRLWLISAVLVVVAAGTYGGLVKNDFIDLDDGKYVTENPHVKGGLTPSNVRWAWSTLHAGYYQPLTWMSLQLDASLFSKPGPGPEPEMKAAGPPSAQPFVHAATTVTLFLVLLRLTGAVGLGAVVAALFAVHPLHVESVAWATERKDVLSTFLLGARSPPTLGG